MKTIASELVNPASDVNTKSNSHIFIATVAKMKYAARYINTKTKICAKVAYLKQSPKSRLMTISQKGWVYEKM